MPKENKFSTHELLESIVDTQESIAVVVMDRDGTITRWNRGAEKITGYSKSEMLGKNFDTLFIHEDQLLNVSGQERLKALADGQVEDERWHQHKEGSRFWASGLTVNLKNRGGDHIALCKIFRETTATKMTEQRLLSENASLVRFSSMVAHDLQEPLRTLSAYSQMLSRKYDDKLDAHGREYLGYIKDGAARLKTLINDLLDLSRATEPAEELTPVDLNAVVDIVISNLSAKIQETRAIVTRVPLPIVLARASLLAQVFQNLISNALSYSGATPPVVSISLEITPRSFLFCVQDNGIGIEPDHLEKIFAPFYRLKSKDTSGTGLGLAISKQAIEAHGGKIWAESEPNRGSRFFFSLPRKLQSKESTKTYG